jgi:uncharacterized protein (DUF1697 family)
MPRYVAFLRAINVGRGRTVKMESLRPIFEELGLSNVTTFLASGNVVFETTARHAKPLEQRIAKSLREALGYPVAVFVRTDAELAEIANYKPFSQPMADANMQLNVILLSYTPDKEIAQKMKALQTDTDEFHVHGREIYWLRRRTPGALAYSTPPLEKTLERPFTIRSARTIRRLAVKYSYRTFNN